MLEFCKLKGFGSVGRAEKLCEQRRRLLLVLLAAVPRRLAEMLGKSDRLLPAP